MDFETRYFFGIICPQLFATSIGGSLPKPGIQAELSQTLFLPVWDLNQPGSRSNLTVKYFKTFSNQADFLQIR